MKWIKSCENDEIIQNNAKSSFFSKIIYSLPSLFKVVFCAYVLLAIILVTFFSRSSEPGTLHFNRLSILAISAILLILNIFLLNHVKPFPTLSEKKFYIFIVICFLAVYFLEIFVTSHIWFYPGWDASIVRDSAKLLVDTNAKGFYDLDSAYHYYYYSKFPNNIIIGHTLALLYKFGKIIFKSNPYFLILLFNNLLVNLSAMFATLCVYKISNSRNIAVISMLQGIVLLCLSPWIVVPYTDTFAIIFPAAIFFSYLYVKNPYIKYPAIVFLGILGYYFKPTVIIILIAFAIIFVSLSLSRIIERKHHFKKYIKVSVLTVATAILTFALISNFVSGEKKYLASDTEFTITHFFMMGLNKDTTGAYSAEDSIFSGSFDNVEQRQYANLTVAKQRLKEFGVSGYLKFLAQKTILNYNDGTFFWAGEGNFYSDIPEKSDFWSNILRGIYYDDGEYYWIYNATEQILWLNILVCTVFCLLGKAKNGFAVELISLTLLGVSMFLLLFECRSRYLICFSPLFIVLSSIGLQQCCKYIESLAMHTKHCQ
jgi:hypothetical protein